MPWLMKVAYSTGSVWACRVAAGQPEKNVNAINRRKHILEHLQDDQGEVVILRRTRGEPVGALRPPR